MPATVGAVLENFNDLYGYDAVVITVDERLERKGLFSRTAFNRGAKSNKLIPELREIVVSEGGRCPGGEARITGAGVLADIDMSQHIIHAIVPVVDPNKLKNKDYIILFSAYYSVLAIAGAQELNKITWPLLGSDGCGWIAEDVNIAVALMAIAYYSQQNPDSNLHVDFNLWAETPVKQQMLQDNLNLLANVDFLALDEQAPDGSGHLASFWANLKCPSRPTRPSLPESLLEVCDRIDGAAMAAQNPRYAPGALDVAPAPAPEAGAALALESAPEAGAAPAPAPVPAAIGRGEPLVPAPAKVVKVNTSFDCLRAAYYKFLDEKGEDEANKIVNHEVFDGAIIDGQRRQKLFDSQRAQKLCTFLEEGKGGYFSGDFAENGIRALIAWELYNNLGGKGVGLKNLQSDICGKHMLPKPDKGIRHNLRWKTEETLQILRQAMEAEYPVPVAIPAFR